MKNLVRAAVVVCLGVFLSILSCTGCAGTQVRVPVEVHEVPEFKGGVHIDVLEQGTSETGFDVYLRFHEYHELHDTVIQEIHFHTEFEDGTKEDFVLVECFKTLTGTFPGRDHHSYHGSTVVKHTRTMRVYTGMTKGEDGTPTFAQLPSNKDKTVLTNIPIFFNMYYQMYHDTAGEVVVDDRENSSYWEIEYVRGASPELIVRAP